MQTPIDAVNSRLSSEDQTLKKDISDLEKRLHYLETTHEKSKEHIEQIFRGRLHRQDLSCQEINKPITWQSDRKKAVKLNDEKY